MPQCKKKQKKTTTLNTFFVNVHTFLRDSPTYYKLSSYSKCHIFIFIFSKHKKLIKSSIRPTHKSVTVNVYTITTIPISKASKTIAQNTDAQALM